MSKEEAPKVPEKPASSTPATRPAPPPPSETAKPTPPNYQTYGYTGPGVTRGDKKA